jgi:hypothetical protein
VVVVSAPFVWSHQLEPGEIDTIRQNLFIKCVKRQQAEQNRAKLAAKAQPLQQPEPEPNSDAEDEPDER